MKRATLLLVPLALLAACGGDDDAASGGDSSTAASETSAGETSASETSAVTSTSDDTSSGEAPATTAISATDDSTDDDATVTGDTADSAGAGGEFSGDPDSSWCVMAREIDAEFDAFETAMFLSPDELETFMGELLGRLDEAVDAAPPEIEDAVATTADAMKRFDEALAAVDYNAVEADLSVLDDVDEASSDLIGRYNEDVCGIPDNGDGTSDDAGSSDEGFDPAAGSIRDQTIAELVKQGFTEDEATCIFDQLDFSDPEFGTDMEAMLEIFDNCGIDLSRMAELGG